MRKESATVFCQNVRMPNDYPLTLRPKPIRRDPTIYLEIEIPMATNRRPIYKTPIQEDFFLYFASE
jgi:hypothetical protein